MTKRLEAEIQMVLDYVNSRSKPFHYQVGAKDLNLNSSTMNSHLCRLKKEGLIIMDYSGCYGSKNVASILSLSNYIFSTETLEKEDPLIMGPNDMFLRQIPYKKDLKPPTERIGLLSWGIQREKNKIIKGEYARFIIHPIFAYSLGWSHKSKLVFGFNPETKQGFITRSYEGYNLNWRSGKEKDGTNSPYWAALFHFKYGFGFPSVDSVIRIPIEAYTIKTPGVLEIDFSKLNVKFK